jgi:Tfp pilus assembly protein PilV
MRLALRQDSPPQGIGRRRPRAGITLVEIMIAVTVLSIGVLGLATTASYVSMQMGGGSQQTNAANVAQTVYDSLAARPCATLSNGSGTKNRVNVAWTVADSGFADYITQTITYKTRRGNRTITFRSMLPCR